ncbi:MAG: PKD domain-containing protein [Bacteroidales bacterium]
MNKFNNLKSLIIVIVIGCFMAGFFFLMRSCGSGMEIRANLSNINLSTGEYFYYSDSTRNANSWLWEFGNGQTSKSRSGKFKYNKEGQYKIRVTVNGMSEKLFTVNVKETREATFSRVIEIQAPESSMQGEYIVFKAEGNDKQWRWSFGESGMIDSREQNPIYKYSEPGVYQVELQTENTKYPVIHLIEVYPQYTESDSTDIISVIGADIKDKLQAIVEGESFNANYNYIVNKYLCKNSKVEVVINNNKYNDVYSYCQGLRIIGKGKVSIELVLAEISNLDTGCITKLAIIQSDK